MLLVMALLVCAAAAGSPLSWSPFHDDYLNDRGWSSVQGYPGFPGCPGLPGLERFLLSLPEAEPRRGAELQDAPACLVLTYTPCAPQGLPGAPWLLGPTWVGQRLPGAWGSLVNKKRACPWGTYIVLLYAHLYRYFVRAGDTVEKGQAIARAGNSVPVARVGRSNLSGLDWLCPSRSMSASSICCGQIKWI